MAALLQIPQRPDLALHPGPHLTQDQAEQLLAASVSLQQAQQEQQAPRLKPAVPAGQLAAWLLDPRSPGRVPWGLGCQPLPGPLKPSVQGLCMEADDPALKGLGGLLLGVLCSDWCELALKGREGAALQLLLVVLRLHGLQAGSEHFQACRPVHTSSYLEPGPNMCQGLDLKAMICTCRADGLHAANDPQRDSATQNTCPAGPHFLQGVWLRYTACMCSIARQETLGSQPAHLLWSR